MRTVKQIPVIILIALILLILSPLVILAVIFDRIAGARSNERNRQLLDEYIQQNEGRQFFCYTRRKKLVYILDNIIIPNLPADVQPVDIGDESGMLYWLARTGPDVPVPFILTITNGTIHKRSINSQLYHAIKHGKDVREVKVV